MAMFQMESPGMAGIPPGPDEAPMYVDDPLPLAPSEEQPEAEVRGQAWLALCSASSES